VAGFVTFHHHRLSISLDFSGLLAMPDPSANAPEASGSSTSNHAVEQPTTEEILSKLKAIQQEAEEHPESDDEGDSDDGEGPTAVASASGGGEGAKKKKKKKKKSKAAKAVANLK
jgi:hypothetical protein